MPLDVSFRGRSVLLAGVDASTASTATALLRDGASVVLEVPDADRLPVSLKDLVERNLIALTAPADRELFDVVIRASASRANLAEQTNIEQTNTEQTNTEQTGSITLLGGGLGDPQLLTIAGLEAIRSADVIVHDRLAPLGALVHARSDAQVIDVGKIPRGSATSQERINQILLRQAGLGRNVLRLKGGDSFVFGRGGEEARACIASGIPVRVIPGISSSIAAPALAGIPVTDRDLVQGFTVVSGHVPPDDPRSTINWRALAQSGTTIVILMGVATLPAVATELVAQGLAPDTPAAVVSDAGLPSMRVSRATVTDIAEVSARDGLRPPAVVVVGVVAALDVLA